MEREIDLVVLRTDYKRTPKEQKAIDDLLASYEGREGYTVRKDEFKIIVYKKVFVK